MSASPSAVTPLQSAARILVVDDTEIIRRLTRRILEDHGYDVLTCPDAASALDVARLGAMQPGTTIDLVLTDIDMPGMDGYALGRRLAVMRPGLPVIYMSGTTHGLAARIPLETWDHFIAKPFSAEELLPKLHFALRRAAHGADTS
jgi:CheY-like chemotaxis protein